MNIENDTVIIKGYTLKNNGNETYIYSDDEFDILAFKFLPGKMKLPYIEYIDIYNSILIEDNYYISYGISRNGRKFCL